ncbi:CapA family protein [Solwaraspora sp. WMMD406]|uniref:CapA family protein n=1 Tax=Solwaraspora sp. WMMD406 TaxID=3016095 RepID=UPI002417C20A|nr:CapA family protein [Solwaraspora sp. WMMD406]MDG4768483.1 CapA family protein [Solwaraspora sp. WMMD406]
MTAVLLVAVIGGIVALGGLERTTEPPQWQSAASPAGVIAAPSPTPEHEPEPEIITLSATGDIVLGNAPDRLPPDDGEGFFDSVTEALAADVVMGNLEEPLTEDTGTGKCGPNSTQCHQFRAPPRYAAHLREAGFTLLNQANNHGYDFGEAGYRNTQQVIEENGMQHTGAVDQIAVLDVDGVTVAVAGFSSYSPPNNSLIDLDAAAAVVRRADELADLVVVQVHMGAEGSEMTRVTPGTELFLGENRGDPMAFSRAVIDAGADLIVGHGPHVLRGMEFYQGRLIAYSLGNFAGGGGTLSNNGRLGWGGVLKVSLTTDGDWVDGEFVATFMNGNGLPTLDEQRRGLDLVRELSSSDFPQTGARFDDDGTIAPPSD